MDSVLTEIAKRFEPRVVNSMGALGNLSHIMEFKDVWETIELTDENEEEPKVTILLIKKPLKYCVNILEPMKILDIKCLGVSPDKLNQIHAGTYEGGIPIYYALTFRILALGVREGRNHLSPKFEIYP